MVHDERLYWATVTTGVGQQQVVRSVDKSTGAGQRIELSRLEHVTDMISVQVLHRYNQRVGTCTSL